MNEVVYHHIIAQEQTDTQPEWPQCRRGEDQRQWCSEDVHGAFGLSYASYLVVPRVLLQDMPAEWQHQFIRLMDRFNEEFPDYPQRYAVLPRDENGQFSRGKDPLRNYRYPDRRAVAAARGTSDE